MKNSRTLKNLASLRALFTRGSIPKDRSDYHTFGTDEASALVLVGESLRAFQKTIAEWLESLPAIKEKLSERSFVDIVVKFIRERMDSGGEFTQEDADRFDSEIAALHADLYKVVRRIYGATVNSGTGPIKMGDFYFYSGEQLKPRLTTDPISQLSWTAEDSAATYIECPVEAIDSSKASEMADILFHRFELIMRVLIGWRTKDYEFGILNYTGPQFRNRILFQGEKPVGHALSWKGAMRTIPLNDPYFSDLPAAFKKLFGLITKTSNDLETHVLRCAEWTGQAIADPNEASALVKAAIALEVMFSINQKAIITPSIMAQIAESCAHVLGSTGKDDPVQIERRVKELYGVRSAIVHSGKEAVLPEDLNELISICRSVILRLLEDGKLSTEPSVSALADSFRKKKYSYLGYNGSDTHRSNGDGDR